MLKSDFMGPNTPLVSQKLRPGRGPERRGSFLYRHCQLCAESHSYSSGRHTALQAHVYLYQYYIHNLLYLPIVLLQKTSAAILGPISLPCLPPPVPPPPPFSGRIQLQNRNPSTPSAYNSCGVPEERYNVEKDTPEKHRDRDRDIRDRDRVREREREGR